MEDILVFVQDQFLLVAGLLVLIGVFIHRESAAAGARLSLNEVIQAMNSERAILVDVREPKEFGQGHVVNAINIPYARFQANLNLLEKHKDKQIIVTDNLGQHAGTIGRQLAKLGYTVARMRGGMAEWRQEGLPLVK